MTAPTLHSEYQRAERHLARAVSAEQRLDAVERAARDALGTSQPLDPAAVLALIGRAP